MGYHMADIRSGDVVRLNRDCGSPFNEGLIGEFRCFSYDGRFAKVDFPNEPLTYVQPGDLDRVSVHWYELQPGDELSIIKDCPRGIGRTVCEMVFFHGISIDGQALVDDDEDRISKVPFRELRKIDKSPITTILYRIFFPIYCFLSRL